MDSIFTTAESVYCEEIKGQAAAIAQISQGVLRSYKDTSRPLTAVDILNRMDASVNSIFANRHRVANASQRGAVAGSGVEASLAADPQLERIQILRGLLAELRGEEVAIAAAAAASGSPSSPQFSSLSQDLGRSSRA